jgi:ubiquinol-cytochrome c reductase cytochrome c1 subunit
VRGTDWLYTYLRSFYEDPRALGGEQQGLPERRHAQRAGRPAGRQVIGCKQVQIVETARSSSTR